MWVGNAYLKYLTANVHEKYSSAISAFELVWDCNKLNANSWHDVNRKIMKDKIVGFRYLGSDFIQSMTGVSSSRVRYIEQSDPLVIHLRHSKILFADIMSRENVFFKWILRHLEINLSSSQTSVFVEETVSSPFPGQASLCNFFWRVVECFHGWSFVKIHLDFAFFCVSYSNDNSTNYTATFKWPWRALVFSVLDTSYSAHNQAWRDRNVHTGVIFNKLQSSFCVLRRPE